MTIIKEQHEHSGNWVIPTKSSVYVRQIYVAFSMVTPSTKILVLIAANMTEIGLNCNVKHCVKKE